MAEPFVWIAIKLLKHMEEKNNKITIGVVMIVKNEEAMLSRCLESVKGADEIIIVDTGSIDKTKEIAGNFTKSIFDFPWVDDFATARNFAISKASTDFLLSIDADEVLEEGGIQKIRDYLTTYKKNVVGIKMKSSIHQYHVPRLFKRSSEIFFKGRIHEVINTTDYDKSNITITYGTSPAHLLDPGRSLRILKKCVVEEPMNTRHLFYLGREYGYMKNWPKAIEVFERYLQLATWLPERADAYFMLALCYWNSQQGEMARKNCLLAISINANFKSAILLMAAMSFEKNGQQWRKMAETATDEDTLFAREDYNNI